MMINSLTRTVLIGLFALALLPVQAWGQAVERPVEAAETGTVDFRISEMGPEGDINFDALHPSVVFNSTDQEFLVVWAGDHGADGDVEIYGQRLDAATGTRVGGAFRISEMGPDGDPAFDAFAPAVAYNRTDNAYLVVWAGNNGPDSELAVYGQRIDAATGTEVGINDFLIAERLARDPAVVYNSADNAYLVVWQGAGEQDPRVSHIYGQRLDAATGNALDTEALRISKGDASYSARRPAVAYNDTDNAYLVVWQGAEEQTPRAVEIFGQRLDAATGTPAEMDAFRISEMGPDGDPAFFAGEPAVAYNRIHREYLVVWVGDDHENGLKDNELEIFGQRLDAVSGKAVGVSDFRISAMGPDGNPAFGAALPDVVYNQTADEYLVVWRGDHNDGALVEGAYEIFGQRLAGDLKAADQAGDEYFRISTMGSSDGDTGFGAIQAAVTYGLSDSYFAVWHGDDDELAADNEHEIFGRYIRAGAAVAAAEEDLVEVPGEFISSSAHPNPFNTATTITLALREAQDIQVLVYDMLGRRVTTLYSGIVEAQQRQTFIFEAGALPSGPYFVRVVGETFMDTQQVLLVK